MRAVWVVEWQHPEGQWFVWNGHEGVCTERREAWHGLRAARRDYPADTFRVVKYVPAKKRAQSKKGGAS